MRLVIARCSVVYEGRGATTLPDAVRLIMVKRDGSVSIHSDDRAYKPLNWMLPPTTISVTKRRSKKHPDAQVWTVASKHEILTIKIVEVLSDTETALEEADPGLVRSWTEPHLQAWIAGHLEEVFREPGWTLVGREYPTGAGPVDLLVRDPNGFPVAVEVKRTATMNAFDQVGRYVTALQADPAYVDVRGMVVALTVKPRARALAASRGVQWLEIPVSAYRD